MLWQAPPEDKELTISCGPVTIHLWICGNPIPVFEKLRHTIKTQNNDVYKIDFNYEDHLLVQGGESLEAFFHLKLQGECLT